MAGRIVGGLILIGLGLGLFGSQMPGPDERLAFGAAMLVIWGGTGLLVLAGLRLGRVAGLVLSVIGIVLGAVVVGQANSGEATLAADLFFIADGPTFSWVEVLFGAIAFVVLSVVALGALVLAGRRRQAVITE